MTTTALSERKPQSLSSEEAAALQVLRDESQSGEVICIVRPKGNSQSESQIIVLDHASPSFLQQLTAQQQVASRPQPAASMQR
jgi:hypothetical protein